MPQNPVDGLRQFLNSPYGAAILRMGNPAQPPYAPYLMGNRLQAQPYDPSQDPTQAPYPPMNSQGERPYSPGPDVDFASQVPQVPTPLLTPDPMSYPRMGNNTPAPDPGMASVNSLVGGARLPNVDPNAFMGQSMNYNEARNPTKLPLLNPPPPSFYQELAGGNPTSPTSFYTGMDINAPEPTYAPTPPSPNPGPADLSPEPMAPEAKPDPYYAYPDATGPSPDYVVQPGDTLWDISRKHGLGGPDWEQLYQRNKDVIGSNPNLIRPGQRLKI